VDLPLYFHLVFLGDLMDKKYQYEIYTYVNGGEGFNTFQTLAIIQKLRTNKVVFNLFNARGYSWNSGFWKDHELVMKEVSVEYPDILFELFIVDEEKNSVSKFFKNNKMIISKEIDRDIKQIDKEMEDK